MGFTRTGQPIQGHKFTISQDDLSIPVTVVGKLFGLGDSADLIAIILEERDSGGRDTLPWPIRAVDGTPPIRFVPGWKE